MGAATRRRAGGRLVALIPLLVALTLALTACGPEGERSRGGGAGSDPGNRGDEVDLRGQGETDQEKQIYFDTPIKRPAEAG